MSSSFFYRAEAAILRGSGFAGSTFLTSSTLLSSTLTGFTSGFTIISGCFLSIGGL
jgi:hypothetical protein